MKKSVLALFAFSVMLSSSAFAKVPVKTNSPQNTVASDVLKIISPKKEKYYKVDWTVKKTGKVVFSTSSLINMNDTLNKNKTGKIVFSPQRVSSGDKSFFLGMGLDMKLFDNKGSNVLGIAGQYSDPNPLIDFTERMPDEQNVAHIVLAPITKESYKGETFSLYTAKFFKAYDLSKPTGNEIVLTRFIIKEPTESSLIEISFKIYEFNFSEEDKP